MALDDNRFVGLSIVDLFEFSSNSDFFILNTVLSSCVVALDYRQEETNAINIEYLF